MNNKSKLGILALVFAVMLVLCACGADNAAQTESAAAAPEAVEAVAIENPAVIAAEAEACGTGWGTVPYIDNDTTEHGEYTPFVPQEEASSFSGTAIEGNDEEELQQERIAGGAVGEAKSQVEELHGITDYSEGEYVPVYGD